MKKQILILLTFIFIFSCNQPSNSLKSGEKVWVYLEIFSDVKKDITEHYIFGKIDKTDLENFELNKSNTNLFKLTDGRYIDDNDKIRDVQELNEKGTYYFRFKDVIYVEVLNSDPLTFE
jgi:hypothetical protein